MKDRATTTTLRGVVKAIDPEARVSKVEDGHWTIRTRLEKAPIVRALSSLGLTHEARFDDLEGSQHDWIYVIHVLEEGADRTAAKKTGRQLDAEIAHALKKSAGKRPPREVIAAFDEMVGNAQAYGAEDLYRDRRAHGYDGDPKEFRFSEIFARKLPTYKYELIVNYVDEYSRHPYSRVGRKLTPQEAEWMLAQAKKIYDDDQRVLREKL